MPTTYPEATVSDAAVYANIAGRAAVPLQDKPFMFNPRAYPLVSTTLLSAQFGQIDAYKGPKPPTCKIVEKVNTVYEVWSSRNPENRVSVNHVAGYDTDDTKIVVDNAKKVRVNSVLYVPDTGERLIVTGRTVATNTITVARNIGGDSAASLPNGTVILVMASGVADASAVGSDVLYEPDVYKNATQIVRTELAVGGQAESEQQQAGPPRGQNRIKKAQELCQKLESLALFGKTPRTANGAQHDFYTVVNDGRCYLTDGFDAYIQTNRIDAGGSLDEGELDTILDQLSEQSTFDEEPIWCYCGPNMMRVVNQLVKDKKVVDAEIPTMYGARVRQYVHTNGPVNFVREPLFKQSNGLAHVAYFLRPGLLEINPKKGRRLNMYPDVKSLAKTGDDQMVDAYHGEMGFFMHFEELHGMVYNING